MSLFLLNYNYNYGEEKLTTELVVNIIFSFVTSLREVLEAALIIGIIASYLTFINRRDLYRDVIYGILAAIGFSITMAWVFIIFFTGLNEYQKLFEGIVMLIAAGVLSWMIIWMNRQAKSIRFDIQKKVNKVITDQEKAGIVLLVFFSVAREGAELVLLLYASYLGSVEELGVLTGILTTLFGLILGLIVAIISAFLIFKTTRKLNIKKFFQITSIILIIFAAGLLAHGLHEIYEFLEISGSPLANLFIWSEMWDINNTPFGDILQFFFGWSYDPLKPGRFEKSMIGGIIVGLFGWNDNPALIEVLTYIMYYLLVILAIKQIKPIVEDEKTKETPSS